MKTAKRIKDWDDRNEEIAGVYQLSYPVTSDFYGTPYTNDKPEETFFIISSKAIIRGEPETLIFPCDRTGRAINFLSLASVDTLSHRKALAKLGYTLIKESQK